MKTVDKVNVFVKKWTKSDKIAQYRKKHSAVRHGYYTLANKYADWDKKMVTFTIPSTVKNKRYKIGKYTKLKELLALRAFIAKEINNSKSDIKYFMNIELGKAYSNPHLHVQFWTRPCSPSGKNGSFCREQENDKTDKVSPPLQSPWLSGFCSKKGQKRAKKGNIGPTCETSSKDSIHLIYNKAIKKFNLNTERCIITEPTHDYPVYHYVVKDYGKGLSDKEIWDLENQKKKMRDQIGSKVRFYSKSSDKFTQKIYRIVYKHYNVLRKYANEFIDKFIGMFFQRPQQRVLREYFSELSVYRTRGQLDELRRIFRRVLDGFGVLYACRDPPCLSQRHKSCFSLRPCLFGMYYTISFVFVALCRVYVYFKKVYYVSSII